MASPRHRDVLSLVERGWGGARECSLDLAAAGIDVVHLIKGRLDPDVRAMIRPRERIRLCDVPRPWFRLVAWAWLMAGAVSGRWRAVLVDHERTLREIDGWCRGFGIAPVLVREPDDGYELLIHGARVGLDALGAPAR